MALRSLQAHCPLGRESDRIGRERETERQLYYREVVKTVPVGSERKGLVREKQQRECMRECAGQNLLNVGETVTQGNELINTDF